VKNLTILEQLTVVLSLHCNALHLLRPVIGHFLSALLEIIERCPQTKNFFNCSVNLLSEVCLSLLVGGRGVVGL
jgi:hypothetical protein